MTVIPRKFILSSGSIITLKANGIKEKLAKSNLFRLWVPDIEALHDHLVNVQGFEKATPALPKGEKYSLRKALSKVWELHMRLYNDGFIDAEVEVRREYLEHLTSRRLHVIYEAFKFYRDVYNKLHIFYVPRHEQIVQILDYFNVKLHNPKTLIPWRPIVIGTAVIGLFALVISKL